MAKLTSQQLMQLDRIDQLLRNMGCTFSIRTPEGHGFDNKPTKQMRPVSKKTKLLRSHGIQRGESKAYIDSYLKGIKLGEVRIVEPGKFAILGASFSNHISPYLCNTLGAGVASVNWDPKEKVFLVHYHGGI